jgi:hypothetical protein
VKTIAGDRKDHAGLAARLKGQRFDGVFDITYAPTLDADVAARLAALDGQPHIVFISTGRVYDHSLPIPYSEETPRRACIGASTRGTRSRRRISSWSAIGREKVRSPS